MKNSHAHESIPAYIANFNAESRLLTDRERFLTETDILFILSVFSAAMTILIYTITEADYSVVTHLAILASCCGIIGIAIGKSVKSTQEAFKFNTFRFILIATSTVATIYVLMLVSHWLIAITLPSLILASIMYDCDE